ncbi:MAG: hypothetical protein OEW98_12335 [Betaproteobacteria bacterium]|nr:hypothetical protein [Betaproteobacteria bacterium]
MPFDASLHRFCIAHDEAFVVPAESLDRHGMRPELARLLLDERRLSMDQLRCLEQGFALYWERCADLFKRAPGAWFAPRQTNLLIAREPHGLLPYLEPFAGTSSLLYLCDLDTHPEYVAVLLVHMERLALLRSVRAATICNLSYWFDRSPDSRRAFARAARSAQRPDAAGFVALARALDWVDDLLHDPLRPPLRTPDEPYIGVNDTGLFVPKRLQGELMKLADDAEGAVRTAMHACAPIAAPGNGQALEALCAWLEQARAHAIIVGPDGSTAWSPEATDARQVKRALEGADDKAIASVHADLRVIHERSRQFLDCVRDRAALPRHCAVLETGGGAYVDAERGAVVYELVQPAFDARTWAAPPYHRLLLGARVMHEWGHVAHTAKMIRVPDERKAGYRQARVALGERFADIVRRMPERLREDIERDTRALVERAGDLPTALARKTLARVGDYLANLLCARLIPAEEMQAYVRTNVRHHIDEQLGIVSELARYAYEVHYLALAGLSRDYFFSTSRFPQHFIEPGIVSEEDANVLFDAAGAVLAHYAIDERLLALPATASAVAG